MRILVFHGYLLRGTGSNVYNARLAAALAHLGHDVDLLCQDGRADELGFVDALGEWGDGEPRVRELRPIDAPGSVTVWRPEIGELLPVYVADRYEGFDARTYLECSDAEIAAYVERNVAAVRSVARRARPDVALANHMVMGPLIVSRGLQDVPYAVKIHGSALEYTVKRDPERFLPAAREGLDGAATVLVGSRHTAESLWAAMQDPALPGRTRLGPPGVDIEEFRPRPRGEAAAGLGELIARLRTEGGPADTEVHAFSRDAGEAADALQRIDPETDAIVTFVGKLIVSKGVDLLAAAWPLVLEQVPRARLVVVGFGAFRPAFERLLRTLAAGDLDGVRALAREGRALEGGPREPLRHLRAFADALDADPEARERYVRAARDLSGRVVLAGRLEHDELVPLLALSEVQVVPSTFPEAFGMVAAEAAACGALPLSAAHSGLAEVTAALAAAVPPDVRRLLSFEVADDAPFAIAERIAGWLRAPEELRRATRAALVELARERYSWDGVARSVIAAAEGRHEDLSEPV